MAASIGPYGATTHDGAEYRGDYGLSVEQLLAFHSRRFGVLAASGADLLACETLPLLDEAKALVALLAENPETIAWMSFTSPDGLHTSHGESLTECARLLDTVPNVIAIGVNCVRPEIVGTAIEAIKAGSHKAIVVYPNSGERWEAESQSWHGSRDHDGLASLAGKWVSAGARLIGGCCRIGPREIAALDTVLKVPR